MRDPFKKGMLRLIEELKQNVRKETMCASQCAVIYKKDLKDVTDILKQIIVALLDQETDMKEVKVKMMNVNRDIEKDRDMRDAFTNKTDKC